MKFFTCKIILVTLLFAACDSEETSTSGMGAPMVKSDSEYEVLVDEDITYAMGLGHNNNSATTFEIPLNLDVYYPDNAATNRPVYMFIHGGGFNGGSKTAQHILSMADYFASRGWVFVSINYRTTADLGNIYTGIAPQEWIDEVLQSPDPEEIPRGIAMYAAQRDAKAALRWIAANAAIYNINKDYITVGGGSAGAITAIALGISDQGDFRDEIPANEDPTLSTTNLNETYVVRSLVDFWGSKIKLDIFESVYGLNRFDSNDPELFIAHGTLDPTVLFSGATELETIYNDLGIYNQFFPLEGVGHGAWNTTVDGKGLFELSFEFLVDRQDLEVQ